MLAHYLVGEKESEKERKKRLDTKFNTMLERKLRSLAYAIGDNNKAWDKVIEFATKQKK